MDNVETPDEKIGVLEEMQKLLSVLDVRAYLIQ
jgi:hypothetical protein